MPNLRTLSRQVRARFREWAVSFLHGSKLHYLEQNLRQIQITNDYIMSIWLSTRPDHPNPLVGFGRKYFSQADEDGILLEIVRRIGVERGVCVEIGVGNGMENNTLNLLVRGWCSVWVDAGGLAFDSKCNPKMLSFQQCFVTVENIVSVVTRGLTELKQSQVDVLSIDVDGNDGYFVDTLLKAGISPSVIVIETNEVVPPPVRFAQPYSEYHIWDRTKNSGWSLQSLADLLLGHEYRCVACNLQTGVNAFFVRRKHWQLFEDVPQNLEDIYVGRSAHPMKYCDRRSEVTPDLIESLIRNSSTA